jgi:hypothetical protein
MDGQVYVTTIHETNSSACYPWDLDMRQGISRPQRSRNGGQREREGICRSDNARFGFSSARLILNVGQKL